MGPSDALCPSPTGRHTCEPCFRRQAHTFSLSVPASGLLSRVGRGDAFNPQMRFNRFVFLNRPVLSLETHLGVTTSPQAPSPADFVTLSVFDKSPPLRLTLSRSRERSCYNSMHSRHAQALPPPQRGGDLQRLGVPYVRSATQSLLGRLGELSLHQIRRPVLTGITHCRAHKPTFLNAPQPGVTHQSRDSLTCHMHALTQNQLGMHPRSSVGALRTLMNGSNDCCQSVAASIDAAGLP
jgi:hypothetical protein